MEYTGKMTDASDLRSPVRGRDVFVTTHWSLVLSGRQSGAESTAALESLCQDYWFPLYAYARRRVEDVHQAQDLTQEFFARLLEQDFLQAADRERGRFRAFLLTAFKRFLINAWHEGQAAKRGGGQPLLSLDFDSGESRLHIEPADDSTPEVVFEKQWALTLLQNVLSRLRDDYVADGREAHFDALKEFISGSTQSGAVAAAAETLEMSPGAVKVAAHRLRRRYRERLRGQIAQTVEAPDEVDDEIRTLFETLGT